MYRRVADCTQTRSCVHIVLKNTKIKVQKWALSETHYVVHNYRLCFEEGKKEMFYITTHSTHFIYGYMASDIWQRTTQMAREETCCRHIGYSFRLAARVILYASSHRHDNTYHCLCYSSRGAMAGTRNSSMGPSHERSIR